MQNSLSPQLKSFERWESTALRCGHELRKANGYKEIESIKIQMRQACEEIIMLAKNLHIEDRATELLRTLHLIGVDSNFLQCFGLTTSYPSRPPRPPRGSEEIAPCAMRLGRLSGETASNTPPIAVRCPPDALSDSLGRRQLARLPLPCARQQQAARVAASTSPLARSGARGTSRTWHFVTTWRHSR